MRTWYIIYENNYRLPTFRAAGGEERGTERTVRAEPCLHELCRVVSEEDNSQPLVSNNKVDLRRDKPSWTNQAAMPSAITVGFVPYTEINLNNSK